MVLIIVTILNIVGRVRVAKKMEFTDHVGLVVVIALVRDFSPGDMVLILDAIDDRLKTKDAGKQFRRDPGNLAKTANQVFLAEADLAAQIANRSVLIIFANFS